MTSNENLNITKKHEVKRVRDKKFINTRVRQGRTVVSPNCCMRLYFS